MNTANCSGFPSGSSTACWLFMTGALKKVLKHRLVTVFVSLLVLVATGYLFVIIPKGFLPVEDTGQLFGFTEGAQDTSYDRCTGTKSKWPR